MTRSLQICGCLGTDCTFVVTMVTGVYLQLDTQCGDKERLEGCDTPVSIAAPSEGWRTLMMQYTHDVCEY